MKKFLAVTLTAAMALSLASCGSTEETTVATTAAISLMNAAAGIFLSAFFSLLFVSSF